jgi:signal transduction histidine kinase
VSVSIGCRDGSLVVEVEDDGVGGAQPKAGSGLAGLADRVHALDGRLTIESEPGFGTHLRAELPDAVVAER